MRYADQFALGESSLSADAIGIFGFAHSNRITAPSRVGSH
jgi:hypothetical protein